MHLLESALRKFETLLTYAYRGSLRRPKTVLLATLAILVFSGFQLKKNRFLLASEDLTDQGVESVELLRSMKHRFDDGYPSTLFIVPAKAGRQFTLNELCQIEEWFSSERLQHPGLKASFSTFDAMTVQSSNPTNLVYGRILDFDCRSMGTQPAQITDAFRLLSHSPWPILKNRLDEQEIVLQLTFNTVESSQFGSFDPRAARPFRERFDAELAPKLRDFQFLWTGDADYQSYVFKGFERARFLNLGILVGLITLLSWTSGSILGGLIFGVTLIFSGIILYGAKGYFHSPFDVLSNCLFMFVAISTLQDFVFVTSVHREGASVGRAIRSLLIPGFYTSLTTILGFLSLRASEVEMIRSFGGWAAFGAFLEWSMLFLVLPSFWKVLGSEKRWVKAKPGSSEPRWALKRIPRPVALGLLALIPISFLLSRSLVTQDSPEFLFPVDHEYRQALTRLSEIKGWKGHAFLTFSPDTPEAETDRVIGKISTSATLKPFVSEIETLERTKDYVAEKVSAQNRPVIDQDFSGTRYAKAFRLRDEMSDEIHKRVPVYLKKIDLESMITLKEEIDSICGHTPEQFGSCTLVGGAVAFAEISKKISRTLFQSLFTCMALVGGVLLILTLGKKQGRNAPWILLSSFWGASVMLGILALFKIPVNFASGIFLSVLVGITGDNAVQYLYGSRSSKQTSKLASGIDKRGFASVQTAVVMALSSLIFLGAYFAPPRKLALLQFTGLLISLFGDLWLLKGLLGKNSASERNEHSRDQATVQS